MARFGCYLKLIIITTLASATASSSNGGFLTTKFKQLITAVINTHKPVPNSKDFDAERVPQIPISDYVDRITKYGNADDADIIYAMIYMDRYTENTGELLTALNAHRFVAISILTAIKQRHSKLKTTKFYANLFGMTQDGVYQ